jgi:hypothetical protein
MTSGMPRSFASREGNVTKIAISATTIALICKETTPNTFSG